MHKVVSHAKSHIYDIHAVIASIVVFLFMMLIKPPMKRWIAKMLEKHFGNRSDWDLEQENYRRRGNMLLIVFVIILGYLIFAVIALLSPGIEFSFFNGGMTGVYALCEYAFYEQITYGEDTI